MRKILTKLKVRREQINHSLGKTLLRRIISKTLQKVQAFKKLKKYKFKSRKSQNINKRKSIKRKQCQHKQKEVIL